MEYDSIRSTVTIRAQACFAEAKGSHDWEHTQRVRRVALHLAALEHADVEVVELAALLHDIARPLQDASNGTVDHAVKGAELARTILQELGVAPDMIEQIVQCIATHRFRGKNIPVSLEARILFDADKLDGIGAIGIGRAFLFAGEIGAQLHDPHVDVENTKEYSKDDSAYREYLVKLQFVKDRMLTDSGRHMAQERHDFMVHFFSRLNQEFEGIL